MLKCNGCIQKIDYSERENKAGRNEIADSLVKFFETTNKRKVTDSRGIEPEIKIEQEHYSSITEALLYQDYIFDFTNEINTYI